MFISSAGILNSFYFNINPGFVHHHQILFSVVFFLSASWITIKSQRYIAQLGKFRPDQGAQSKMTWWRVLLLLNYPSNPTYVTEFSEFSWYHKANSCFCSFWLIVIFPVLWLLESMNCHNNNHKKIAFVISPDQGIFLRCRHDSAFTLRFKHPKFSLPTLSPWH